MSVGENVEKSDPLHIAAGNVKWCSHGGKHYGGSSKLNIDLPYQLVTLLLGMYPKELKAGTQTDICTPGFKAASFTIAERWKQTKSPLMDKQNVLGKTGQLHVKE